MLWLACLTTFFCDGGIYWAAIIIRKTSWLLFWKRIKRILTQHVISLCFKGIILIFTQKHLAQNRFCDKHRLWKNKRPKIQFLPTLSILSIYDMMASAKTKERSTASGYIRGEYHIYSVSNIDVWPSNLCCRTPTTTYYGYLMLYLLFFITSNHSVTDCLPSLSLVSLQLPGLNVQTLSAVSIFLLSNMLRDIGANKHMDGPGPLLSQ